MTRGCMMFRSPPSLCLGRYCPVDCIPGLDTLWFSSFNAGKCRSFVSKRSRYILIIVQRDATQNSLFIILQVHSTCFGCQPHPSSRLHKTVSTASGTGHIFCSATSLRSGQLATLEGGSCTVLESVVTVLCTSDDGCG